jgi:hypothetical protein
MSVIAERCDGCGRDGRVYYFAASRRALCPECIARARAEAESALAGHQAHRTIGMRLSGCVWC